MFFFKFLLLFLIKSISTEDHVNFVSNLPTAYNGMAFPEKYLVPEDITPTVSDLNYYLVSITKTINYFARSPNVTNISEAMGTYSMNSILKRSLQDYGSKISKKQRTVILNIIKKGEFVLSHFLYLGKLLYKGKSDMDYRLTRIFEDDAPMIHTLAEFNRYKLKKWLRKNINMNEYIQEIDSLSLPKEKYVEIASLDHNESIIDHYHIKIHDSDLCLSRLMFNSDPIDLTAMQPCRQDKFCFDVIYRGPSIGYHLSHRMLNNLMYNAVRRCYLHSEVADREHIEMLCAFMYREAVYLARRGYFFRDLFLEHIALCGFLGYEEFFRRHWFYKVASWIDDEGCIAESANFLFNSSRILAKHKYPGNPEEEKKYRKQKQQSHFKTKCHLHQMALLLVVLSHGIRHALHFMPVV